MFFLLVYNAVFSRKNTVMTHAPHRAVKTLHTHSLSDINY